MSVSFQSPTSSETLKPVKLEDLLSYRHPHVLKRFQKDYGHSPAEADLWFEDLMRFFYLGYCNRRLILEGKTDCHFVAMYPPLLPIDDLWHTFLLFTRDYAEFCQEYFGYFIHHTPNVEETPPEDAPERLQQFLELVYDELGEEVFVRWFREYC
uniref:Uncharacterized protein n=1 Tax=Cyanothece sp. (strain PCC 7425 / ATCC 29141) TaxID=395961 RepID=B8HQA6_CYAP4